MGGSARQGRRGPEIATGRAAQAHRESEAAARAARWIAERTAEVGAGVDRRCSPARARCGAELAGGALAVSRGEHVLRSHESPRLVRGVGGPSAKAEAGPPRPVVSDDPVAGWPPLNPAAAPLRRRPGRTAGRTDGRCRWRPKMRTSRRASTSAAPGAASRRSGGVEGRPSAAPPGLRYRGRAVDAAAVILVRLSWEQACSKRLGPRSRRGPASARMPSSRRGCSVAATRRDLHSHRTAAGGARKAESWPAGAAPRRPASVRTARRGEGGPPAQTRRGAGSRQSSRESGESLGRGGRGGYSRAA
jgi:hypothetical protein